MKPVDAEVSPDGDITVECGLDEPPEKVWRALTVPELVADWLGAEPADRESAPGEKTYEIVETRPYSRLRYRWRDNADESLSDSFVTIELAPREDGGTWFRLTHAPARVRPANGNAPPVALAA
jgi:uncharacterized protein YndB with AHSA1/START domain